MDGVVHTWAACGVLVFRLLDCLVVRIQKRRGDDVLAVECIATQWDGTIEIDYCRMLAHGAILILVWHGEFHGLFGMDSQHIENLLIARQRFVLCDLQVLLERQEERPDRSNVEFELIAKRYHVQKVLVRIVFVDVVIHLNIGFLIKLRKVFANLTHVRFHALNISAFVRLAINGLAETR
mgnify:CR=1 FL=1